MLHLLVVFVLSALSISAHAVQTPYEWTIDWQTSPDESGIFVFDDLGQDNPQVPSNWFNYLFAGISPPNFVDGLPPHMVLNIAASFEGSTLTGIRGCNDYFSVCAPAPFNIIIYGWTEVSFGTQGNTATRAKYAYANRPGVEPGCSATGGFSYWPGKCFEFETGVTTLTAVPEPTTYALMLVGLGALSVAARRRRQHCSMGCGLLPDQRAPT